jgi:multidrug efflux pump subunit AcrA (membrane-fusion protein)
MAGTQKGSERKSLVDNSDEKIKTALEKARAEAKTAKARARAEEEARLKAEEALAQALELKATVQAEIEAEREARIRIERGLTELQEDLKIAQEELQRERQARANAEQARDEVEKAWAAERSQWLNAGKAESPALGVEEKGAERRVSFVVRLTVDERGQPKRTEVEHSLSGKKEAFPSLDVQRMAAFMKDCISPLAVLIPASPADLIPAKAEVETVESKKPGTTMTVSSVQVFRVDVPGVPASFLNQNEAFVVHVCFQLEGPEALSVTAKEPPFEVQIYSRVVGRGGSSLLKSYRANLVKGLFEYTAQIQMPGLPTGLHRLFTQVALNEPVKMISYFEGPVIKVKGEKSSAEPITAMKAPLPSRKSALKV